MNSRFFIVSLCLFSLNLVYGSPIDSKNNETDTKHDTGTKPVAVVTGNITTNSNATVVPVTKNQTSPSTIHIETETTAIPPSTVANVTHTTQANVTVVNSTVTPAANETKPTVPTKATTHANMTITTEKTTTTKMPTTVSTTEASVTVIPAAKSENRQNDRGFDGPSFVGGIVLALGMTGIGFVAYKFCKGRTDRNYRNL